MALETTYLLYFRLAFLALFYVFLWALTRSARQAFARPAERAEAIPPLTLVVLQPARSQLAEGARLRVASGAILGRDTDMPVAVREDTVSAQHARFTYRRRSWHVEDLKSSNGTFVNGRPLKGQAQLSGGEHLQTGHVVFQVIVEQPK